MNISICTIQRNRGRWLKEWLAFHYAVGFRKFYVFLHKCTDNSKSILSELSEFFDITAFVLADDVDRPQLAAYDYCYSNYGSLHDWMAFIDGDEFLFSPVEKEISTVLTSYQATSISALGVHWVCFGSSGHIVEPDGLIVDNYRYRSQIDFASNRHFKSIVKGGDPAFSVLQNSHYFRTSNGTFDLLMRPLEFGISDNYPCVDLLRINHYATQSRSYFIDFKKNSGAADAGSQVVRSEEWWTEYDRNEIFDESLAHIRSDISEILAWLPKDV